MSSGTLRDGPRRMLRTMGVLMPLVALLGGCGTRHRLAEYEFRGLTLAVEPSFPPYPEVLTGPYLPGHSRDPIHAIVRAGTRLARAPIAPAIFGGPSAVRDVVTAAALASLSVEDVARALRQLAYYSADQVTDRLRAALDDTRR